MAFAASELRATVIIALGIPTWLCSAIFNTFTEYFLFKVFTNSEEKYRGDFDYFFFKHYLQRKKVVVLND